MSLLFRNLDELPSFEALRLLGTNPLKVQAAALSPSRVRQCAISTGGGISYHYAAKGTDDALLSALQRLADEQQLIAKYRAILAGETMNTGEKRPVLHHLTRGQQAGEVLLSGVNKGIFYQKQQERIDAFAQGLHAGTIRGSTGKPFRTVIQIGIGGSVLGPEALYLALASSLSPLMRARFISNVDPDNALSVLEETNLEEALIVFVTKSGTTQETLHNLSLVCEAMGAIDGLIPDQHMIAVTSESSPLAESTKFREIFYIDDYIGGRFSSTSAVGGGVLSLAFGKEVFHALLRGAAESDALAMQSDIFRNAPLLDALFGVYERNVLGYGSTAVLPYCQGFSRFPAHLQQLDMESNGKSVNRFASPLSYATGPVVFGEPCTNAQHSFFQLLHQGSDVVPLQFLGFRKAGRGLSPSTREAHRKLLANLAAQIVAFALGEQSPDPNKTFPGGRPVSLLLGDKFTPEALGALLSHYENKILFQGLLWNINSFDQEGVQLGKRLTGKILGKGALEEPLHAHASLLGLVS